MRAAEHRGCPRPRKTIAGRVLQERTTLTVHFLPRSRPRGPGGGRTTLFGENISHPEGEGRGGPPLSPALLLEELKAAEDNLANAEEMARMGAEERAKALHERLLFLVRAE